MTILIDEPVPRLWQEVQWRWLNFTCYWPNESFVFYEFEYLCNFREVLLLNLKNYPHESQRIRKLEEVDGSRCIDLRSF